MFGKPTAVLIPNQRLRVKGILLLQPPDNEQFV